MAAGFVLACWFSANLGRTLRRLGPLLVLACIICCAASNVFAQSTPSQKPEVRQAVDRGAAYLDANDDPRLGARALVGRVMIALQKRDDPKVERAVNAIRADLASGREIDMYSLGLSILLLVELDAEKHRGEIVQLLNMLRQRQKPNGGWGYPNRPTSDNSMTQYAVLSAWVASEAGFEIPRNVWVRAAQYFLQVQDPTGGYGYQAVDPTTPDTLVPQIGISTTLTYASLASLYLCGEQLGLVQFATPRDSALPSVLKEVTRPEDTTADTAEISKDRFRATIERAENWYQSRKLALPSAYHFYFFYTLERMETIRDFARGKIDPVPSWFPDISTALLRSQQKDGAWNSNEGAVPATAFAVLTLLRTTRQTLDKQNLYGAGTLISGRGLPGGSDAVEIRQGKAVVRPLSGPAEELFNKLGDADAPEFDRALASLDDLVREADAARLSPLAKQLRALATGGPASAKATALRALAKARNFDDVPLLIEALQSEDDEVFRAADEGLRLMSRRLGVPPLGQQLTNAERAGIVRRWQSWYQTIFPDFNTK